MFGARPVAYTSLTYTFPTADGAKKCMADVQITRLFNEAAGNSLKLQDKQEVTFQLPTDRVKELKDIMESNYTDATTGFKICRIM